MTEATVSMDVRTPTDATSVIDIEGEITATCEGGADGRLRAGRRERTRFIVLNFTGLEYMNSSGIGLLVTLLVRANRNRQQLLAFGLTEHYRQIFELTRLDEAIGIHDDEAAALAAAGLRGGATCPPSRTRTRRRGLGEAGASGSRWPASSPGRAAINVAGRRPTSPVQGFGRMWQKTYRVPWWAARRRRREVIAVWKRDFPHLLARSRAASSHRWPGIQPGEVAVLNLGMPGGLKLSTGVLVMYADDESFTLMTPQGHMFAGWITFSAFEHGRRHRRPGARADARVRPALRDGHDVRRARPGGPALGAHAALAGRRVRRGGGGRAPSRCASIGTASGSMPGTCGTTPGSAPACTWPPRPRASR